MIVVREHIVQNQEVSSTRHIKPFVTIKECIDHEGKIHFMKQRVDENTFQEVDPKHYGLAHYAEKTNS